MKRLLKWLGYGLLLAIVERATVEDGLRMDELLRNRGVFNGQQLWLGWDDAFLPNLLTAAL